MVGRGSEIRPDAVETEEYGGPGNKSRVQRLYNRLLRPHLPYKLSIHNGVIARGAKLLDFTDRFPEYEEAILSALRSYVYPGDEVVIVGGGLGVSSVVAAELVGESGNVTTYEGGAEQAELVAETLEMNDVSDRVNLVHGVVGEAVSLYTDAGDAAVVSPSELPECSVLEMDCEGAELEILRNLKVRPRVLVVETHGEFGAPEDTVRPELDRLGYEVVDRVVEHAANDIHVLSAVREDATVVPG